jgi:hypothetical protein
MRGQNTETRQKLATVGHHEALLGIADLIRRECVRSIAVRKPALQSKHSV